MSILSVALSPALLEANRLLQVQQTHAKTRRLTSQRSKGQGEESFSRQSSPKQLDTAVAIIAALPKHLGWSSASLTAFVRQEQGGKEGQKNRSRKTRPRRFFAFSRILGMQKKLLVSMQMNRRINPSHG